MNNQTDILNDLWSNRQIICAYDRFPPAWLLLQAGGVELCIAARLPLHARAALRC